MRHVRRQKNIVRDAQNNHFVIYIIIEKVDISVLEKNIVYIVKKLHNKRII